MKGHHTHVVPLLSPVLEDFVPPQFRGSVPDDAAPSPTTVSVAAAAPTVAVTATATEAPPNWHRGNHRQAPVESNSTASSSDHGVDTGIRSRVSLMLHHWRKSVERGPVQVPVQKPVQVQELRRENSKKYSKSRKTVGHYLNPLSLLAKLRDTYIHMMNGVATSGIVPSGGPVGDSSAQQSTLFFSREFNAEAIAELVELERSCSKPDSDYRQSIECARNSSKVKPYGNVPPSFNKPGVKLLGEAVLGRSKTTRNHADVVLISTTRSGRRLSGPAVLSRSKSNSFSDEVFFSRNLKGSRKKKMHINPYADSDWKADAVSKSKAESKVGPNDFHFQRETRNAGTESRTEFRLQHNASTGSLM